MKSKPITARIWRPRRSTIALIVCLTWLAVTFVAIARLRFWEGLVIGAVAACNCVLTYALFRRNETLRWHAPIARLARSLAAVKSGKELRIADDIPSDLEVLRDAMLEILIDARTRVRRERESAPVQAQPLSIPRDDPADVMLERSGWLNGPHGPGENPYLSAEYATTDMINRLDPQTYHWIDSSQAEQALLGWCLADLRGRSFLDILHEPDRPRAQAHFEKAIGQGEAFGLIVRSIGADGRKRAIEINAAARYNADLRLTHIRCHLTDVTAKVRIEVERRRRNRELTRVNTRLLRLEAELHEKNSRLALANAELSQKNRELDEFVHVVSHDLQEPLRTLIAFSDFLERDYGDRVDGDGKEYIRYITEASRRMRAMIVGLLHLSRLGKVTGDFTRVDLNDVVAVVITDLQELIRSKAAQVCIPRPLPTVWGDHCRLGQLFTNLISNALKYNRATSPRVELGAIEPSQTQEPGDPPEQLANPNTVLYVKDNGIGIEPQFHRTIFQLFRRLHTREEFEGTGVGLSLCGKIVQAHGGTLWVESELGHGSTFFISLPPAPLDSSQTVADPTDESAADLATLQV
jgi:PAS domain S-box-containing protein